MSYLIDGNNVMAQRVGWHKDKAGARRRLMNELARFARARGVSVSVVFDGAPDEHFPDGASYLAGVRVFYAARGSNADERIKAMVESSRQRRTLIVVTSDRALADYIRRCGVREVVRSGDFRRRLDETASASPANSSHDSADDRPPLPNEETADWLRYFGVGPEDEEP
ncbi:MAG: NYN domain-containing protein [Acidobacteriota bacterium]|nr:NYN domain-containing protein [Acidobacteriota bacterium]